MLTHAATCNCVLRVYKAHTRLEYVLSVDFTATAVRHRRGQGRDRGGGLLPYLPGNRDGGDEVVDLATAL